MVLACAGASATPETSAPASNAEAIKQMVFMATNLLFGGRTCVPQAVEAGRSCLLAHDLVGKPVPTFRDHALRRGGVGEAFLGEARLRGAMQLLRGRLVLAALLGEARQSGAVKIFAGRLHLAAIFGEG